MIRHRLSSDDQRFRADFEAGVHAPGSFGHREHVRLAYVYLAEHVVAEAATRMRGALLGFLGRHGIPLSKYHETLTMAWILAVAHLMERTRDSASADDFIEANPMLLDKEIMSTHYSAESLFSEEARARFVEPDLDPIPRHEP